MKINGLNNHQPFGGQPDASKIGSIGGQRGGPVDTTPGIPAGAIQQTPETNGTGLGKNLGYSSADHFVGKEGELSKGFKSAFNSNNPNGGPFR